jgi:hypothetical protein
MDVVRQQGLRSNNQLTAGKRVVLIEVLAWNCAMLS